MNTHFLKARLLITSFLLVMLFMNATDRVHTYAVGDKVKDFTLKNIDDKDVTLSKIANAKGIILTFTCNTCPFAVAYEDRIIDLHNKYASKGFPVVAINPNDLSQKPEDSFEAMKKRAKDKKFPFAYLRDEKQDIAKEYGASKTPHIYILKKSGDAFVIEYIGGIDDNAYEPEKVTKRFAEEALEEILAGKKVTNANTKAIGCTIKWKNS